MSNATILIACDSFKGSLDAERVNLALRRGWLSARPHDRVSTLAMADGGEGTLAAIAAASPQAELVPVRVSGPLSTAEQRDVAAAWLRVPTPSGVVGVVELATCCGITLLPRFAPQDAHTLGFGQAIAHALGCGVDRLVLAIGGSASTDAGVGMLSALGVRLLDAHGAPITPGNRELSRLAAVDWSSALPLPPGGVQVLTDVRSPLCGESGAAHVFGEQKGADARTRSLMDEALRHAAGVFVSSRSGAVGQPADPSAAGAGAAGGTGFALAAWGASLVSGAAGVAELLRLDDHLRDAVLLITGEGHFDSQSAQGKVVGFLLDAAQRAGREVALVAGGVSAGTDRFVAAFSLSEIAGGVDAAIADPERWLAVAGDRLAREFAARM